MSAGLPGVGLSGAFFIVSALVAVPLELTRTLRGQSSLARWGAVLGHFALAITMIAGLMLFYAALHLVLAGFPDLRRLVTRGALGAGHGSSVVHLQMIPVLPVLATLGLVACVTGIAKGAELLSRAAHRRTTAKVLEARSGGAARVL